MFSAQKSAGIGGSRPGWLVSMMGGLLATMLPTACSFSSAGDRAGGADAGPGIDGVPPSDGGPTFEADSMPSCVTTTPQTTMLPPDVLIVLDRSGSMKDKLDGTTCTGGCGLQSKWTEMTGALNTFIPTVQTTVNWGLKLFASTDLNGGCDVSAAAEVGPATSSSDAIRTSIGQALPGSSTPTTAAVMNAATYLVGLKDGNPKFILLATDGLPTCGKAQCAPGVVAMGSQTQCDDDNAIATVKAVHDVMGIATFVIGIGTATGGGDATLTSMAKAGGFARATTPAYYPVASAADLTDAFKTITGMVGSCSFRFAPGLQPGQMISAVKADGTALLPSDYVLMGNDAVQLLGQACTDATAGTIKNVTVQVDCIG